MLRSELEAPIRPAMVVVRTVAVKSENWLPQRLRTRMIYAVPGVRLSIGNVVADVLRLFQTGLVPASTAHWTLYAEAFSEEAHETVAVLAVVLSIRRFIGIGQAKPRTVKKNSEVDQPLKSLLPQMLRTCTSYSVSGIKPEMVYGLPEAWRVVHCDEPAMR